MSPEEKKKEKKEEKKKKKWRMRWSEINDGKDETELCLCLTTYRLMVV